MTGCSTLIVGTCRRGHKSHLTLGWNRELCLLICNTDLCLFVMRMGVNLKLHLMML